MNKLTDEILNRYLDNELDRATLKMVRERLNSSDEDRKRLRALEAADKSLRNMSRETVSPDFTAGLMKKINRKSTAKNEQRVFILSVSSVFVIIALGIIGYVMALIFSGPSGGGGTVAGTSEALAFLNSMIKPLKNLFGGTNISVIGSVFSLGLLVSIYFVLDLLKHSRTALGRQHPG